MDADVPRLMVLRAVRDAGGILAAAAELRCVRDDTASIAVAAMLDQLRQPEPR